MVWLPLAKARKILQTPKSPKRLWAPWRIGYLVGTKNSSARGCFFCRIQHSALDAKNHLLTRGRRGFSVLNRFPYNNGHLLIAPYRHVGRLGSLTAEEWLDLLELSKDGLQRLKRVMSPHGYNLGINLGRSAGAGIPGHLHLHIVPRWVGDTNFMPIIAEMKVISQSLDSAYSSLKWSRKGHAKKVRRKPRH
ncbi:MAG: HIT domain-containing protein [Candidatus Omnitrophica bacterium]|nr:HIT domain-containing protein [Candidatus Omnitrophota bacterium]